MKTLITYFSTLVAAAVAWNASGQGIIFGNMGNTNGDPAATSGGLVWTNSGGSIGLWDGFYDNLGMQILGGSSSSSLSPIALILPDPAHNQYTGWNYGQFLPQQLQADYTVPGVAPGATAWIELQLWWYEQAPSAISFAQAQAAGATTWQAIFQNPTGGPSRPDPMLTGMPALVSPEPTTLSLGALGLGLMLAIHRRR